jgi:hypothetical protein
MKQCRVYRVRTTRYTVRYNQWGAKPHTRGSIFYSTDLSQIGNMIIIIFVNICVEGGKRLSRIIHSFIPPQSLINNIHKYFSTKLFIHFILLLHNTSSAFLQWEFSFRLSFLFLVFSFLWLGARVSGSEATQGRVLSRE